MTAGLETPPAPPKTDTTLKTDSAGFSQDTQPARSSELIGTLTPEQATDLIISDIYALFAEQDISLLLEEFKALEEGSDDSDTPFYEINPQDYDSIRITNSLFLLSYRELPNESAQRPDIRAAACKAYVSIAEVYLAEAEYATTAERSEELEEKALPYLIAGLATQARSDQDITDNPKVLPSVGDKDIQTEQNGTSDVDTTEVKIENRWHQEARMLIDLIVDRREYRKEAEDILREEEERARSKRIEADVGRIAQALAQYKKDTGVSPTPEIAQDFVPFDLSNADEGSVVDDIAYYKVLSRAVKAALFNKIVVNKTDGTALIRHEYKGDESTAQAS